VFFFFLDRVTAECSRRFTINPAMSTRESDKESQELLQHDHQNDDWKLDVGKLGPYKKSDADLKSIKNKKERKFYKKQNELIGELEKIEAGELDNKDSERIGMEENIFCNFDRNIES